MGLVRRGGNVYLYRSPRRAGKAVTRYVASGQQALLLASLYARDRDEIQNTRAQMRRERVDRRAAREAWGVERVRLGSLERSITDHGRQVNLVFRLAMHASGLA